MRFLLQVALLTLAAYNVQSCGDSAEETLVGQIGNGAKHCATKSNMIDVDENDLPIQIVSQNPNGEEVTFGIVQNLYSGTVSKVALNYHRGPTDVACEVNSDVAADWTETYTAVCFEGKATVKVYLHFCDNGGSECDYCAVPEEKNDYLALSFELECYEPCETTVPATSPTSNPQTVSGQISENVGSLGDPHCKFITLLVSTLLTMPELMFFLLCSQDMAR